MPQDIDFEILLNRYWENKSEEDLKFIVENITKEQFKKNDFSAHLDTLKHISYNRKDLANLVFDKICEYDLEFPEIRLEAFGSDEIQKILSVYDKNKNAELMALALLNNNISIANQDKIFKDVLDRFTDVFSKALFTSDEFDIHNTHKKMMWYFSDDMFEHIYQKSGKPKKIFYREGYFDITHLANIAEKHNLVLHVPVIYSEMNHFNCQIYLNKNQIIIDKSNANPYQKYFLKNKKQFKTFLCDNLDLIFQIENYTKEHKLSEYINKVTPKQKEKQRKIIL